MCAGGHWGSDVRPAAARAGGAWQAHLEGAKGVPRNWVRK